jgi:bifunctional non-homologous end joining protein LigD
MGARDQARRLPADRPARRRSRAALHSPWLQLGGPLPRIVEGLRTLRARSVIIDGEAVWCGKDGKSDFEKLHSGAHDAHVFLYGFDLIELDGEDLRPAPLEQRKGRLEKLLARSDGIRFSEHLDGDGATIFAHACKLGLEGIVSKRRDLPYRSGRCRAWVKVKNPASAAVLRIEQGTW